MIRESPQLPTHSFSFSHSDSPITFKNNQQLHLNVMNTHTCSHTCHSFREAARNPPFLAAAQDPSPGQHQPCPSRPCWWSGPAQIPGFRPQSRGRVENKMPCIPTSCTVTDLFEKIQGKEGKGEVLIFVRAERGCCCIRGLLVFFLKIYI